MRTSRPKMRTHSQPDTPEVISMPWAIINRSTLYSAACCGLSLNYSNPSCLDLHPWSMNAICLEPALLELPPPLPCLNLSAYVCTCLCCCTLTCLHVFRIVLRESKFSGCGCGVWGSSADFLSPRSPSHYIAVTPRFRRCIQLHLLASLRRWCDFYVPRSVFFDFITLRTLRSLWTGG